MRSKLKNKLLNTRTKEFALFFITSIVVMAYLFWFLLGLTNIEEYTAIRLILSITITQPLSIILLLVIRSLKYRDVENKMKMKKKQKEDK